LLKFLTQPSPLPDLIFPEIGQAEIEEEGDKSLLSVLLDNSHPVNIVLYQLYVLPLPDLPGPD
jgi:hypothetical protein